MRQTILVAIAVLLAVVQCASHSKDVEYAGYHDIEFDRRPHQAIISSPNITKPILEADAASDEFRGRDHQGDKSLIVTKSEVEFDPPLTSIPTTSRITVASGNSPDGERSLDLPWKESWIGALMLGAVGLGMLLLA